MKYYKVRINSGAFQDIVVKADNKEEAEELAMNLYSHDEYPEFCEFLPLDKYDIANYKKEN